MLVYEDDRQLEIQKLKTESKEERDASERRYYENRVFKRKLSDAEWEDFWKDEKKKLGYKD